jgi:hypothetical protein
MEVMFMRIGRLALLAGVITATLARPAAAAEEEAHEETVRQSRPGFLAFSPAWPVLAGHDVTMPLPGLRVGVNFSTHLALDLTGGLFPQTGGSNNLVDVGARWFFLDGNASPYVMARAGRYHSYNDEGPDHDYGYVTLGAGAEYAGDGGFVASLEAGPALVGGDRGWYYNFSLGYRFGSRPQ